MKRQDPKCPWTGNLGVEERGEPIPIIQSAARSTPTASAAVDNALRGQKYIASPETAEGGEVGLGGREAADRGRGRSKKSMRKKKEKKKRVTACSSPSPS